MSELEPKDSEILDLVTLPMYTDISVVWLPPPLVEVEDVNPTARLRGLSGPTPYPQLGRAHFIVPVHPNRRRVPYLRLENNVGGVVCFALRITEDMICGHNDCLCSTNHVPAVDNEARSLVRLNELGPSVVKNTRARRDNFDDRLLHIHLGLRSSCPSSTDACKHHKL